MEKCADFGKDPSSSGLSGVLKANIRVSGMTAPMGSYLSHLNVLVNSENGFHGYKTTTTCVMSVIAVIYSVNACLKMNRLRDALSISTDNCETYCMVQVTVVSLGVGALWT